MSRRATVTRLLHLLPPERAHRAAIRLLPWLPSRSLPPHPALRVRLAGLDLPHPLGLAAGFDKDAEAPAALLRQGFAFVEVGTVTPRPQIGNPRPRLFRLVEDEAVINRMGFNNAGAEEMAQRLAGRDPRKGVVGVNIGINKDAAEPVADYGAGLERFQALADYVTVNVSSPNTPGLRALQRHDALDRLLGALAATRTRLAGARKPLFLKVAPDLAVEEVGDIAALALAHGIDGLIVGNTTVARPSGLRSVHASEAGGLSGRPLLVPSTRLLACFAIELRGRLPLIGVGGVASGADAYAKIRAGATAVQLYTALVYGGLGVVERILTELKALLANDGYAGLAAAVGVDAERLGERPR
jgi:dihydroorotate dehydrogenase